MRPTSPGSRQSKTRAPVAAARLFKDLQLLISFSVVKDVDTSIDIFGKNEVNLQENKEKPEFLALLTDWAVSAFRAP
jgi:hypothetical protein